jgi:hypothetical protein
MVRTLNRHPKIYVSHESDICWILYQYDRFGKQRKPSFGRQYALKHTLRACRRYYQKTDTVMDNFVRMQTKLMRRGSPWLRPMRKKPEYIGDKAPNNMVVFPEFVDWMKVNFPDSVYIHMTRHPRDFVASLRGRFPHRSPFGKTDKQFVAWWVKAERRVLELKKELPITTIRYKDIGGRTAKTANKLFAQLGLRKVKGIKNQFVKTHDYKVPLTREAIEIAEMYGL